MRFISPLNSFRRNFDVHALVGAEIQPLMRQPISSAQSVLTGVAPRGFSSDSVGRGGPGNSPLSLRSRRGALQPTRSQSVEVVQATHHLFTQPEGRTATDRCLAIRRGRATPSGPQGRPTMAHGSPGRKRREKKKAGEGRKPTQGVSRGGLMGWKRVPYFAEKEGQFRP